MFVNSFSKYAGLKASLMTAALALTSVHSPITLAAKTGDFNLNKCS